jgi:hypothetical protein
MKILYRILVILLWIPIIYFFIFGLPIALIISPVIYLFTGRTKGLFFDMYLKGLDYLRDVVKMLTKKGE